MISNAIKKLCSVNVTGLTFFEKFGIFVLVVSLHYMLNPSESDVAFVVVLGRLSFGLVIVGAILIRSQSKTLIISSLVFISICFSWFVINNFGGNVYPLFSLFGFLVVGVFCSLAVVDSRRNSFVVSSISLLLIFWVGALLIQISIYLFTGEIVDFHVMLHPFSEARIVVFEYKFVRFTGFQIEPGTYSNWVYGLVLVRALATRRLFDSLNVLAMVSVAVSLSAWGLIVSALYCFCALAYWIPKLGRIRRNQVILIVFIGAGLSVAGNRVALDVFSNDLSDYVQVRSELIDESGEGKVAAYSGFYNILEEVVLFGKPLEYDYCSGCVSPQDAGILVNLIVRTGLVFSVIISCVVLFAFFSLFGVYGMICVLPLAFAKFYYYEPMFWLIISSVFMGQVYDGHVIRRDIKPAI